MTEDELRALEGKVAVLLDRRGEMYKGFEEKGVVPDSMYSPIYHAASLWLESRRAARGGDADA